MSQYLPAVLVPADDGGDDGGSVVRLWIGSDPGHQKIDGGNDGIAMVGKIRHGGT